MKGYLDDGELPADFLAQYPVAQDEPTVKPPPAPKQQLQQQESNIGHPGRRRPQVYLDHNPEIELEDWFQDCRNVLIRATIGVLLLMTACMICGLWSMYT